MPQIGLILTSAPSIAWLREQIQTAKAEVLKVVPAWGLHWTPELIAEAVRLAPTLVVRTSWGDPSYADGARVLPVAEEILAELRPWLSARPDAWIEIGNEPLIKDQAHEKLAWDYRWHLEKAITAIRQSFPRARLIAPAHLRNHQVKLGEHADGQGRWDAICSEQLRRCDALGLHAYSVTQAVSGMKQLRDLVSGAMPIWLTEFALNEQLEPAARGRRYREILDVLPVATAIVYHLDHAGGTDPAHFRAEYQLQPGTLAALAEAPSPAPAPAPAKPLSPAAVLPDTVLYPKVRLDGFDLDVRQWRTVEAFRRHLAGYNHRQTAAWAKGVVVHHSAIPTEKTWAGTLTILGMAKHYRDHVDNGPGKPKGGWTTGPHLFVVAGSPNPALDGIWQFTPLNLMGTHARAANNKCWGLEVVGDYTRSPWSPATAGLAIGTAAALLDWASLPTNRQTVSPHREWGKPECPGDAVNMDTVRRGIASLRGGR